MPIPIPIENWKSQISQIANCLTARGLALVAIRRREFRGWWSDGDGDDADACGLSPCLSGWEAFLRRAGSNFGCPTTTQRGPPCRAGWKRSAWENRRGNATEL